MDTASITLRFAGSADEPFLTQLFSDARATEFATLGADAAAHLLQMQYAARRRDLRARFDPAGDHVIELDGEPVGRMWVHCDGSDWELVDLAVLSEHRCRGIGGVLVRDLAEQADRNGATLHLDVRVDNLAAQRLYYRVGFGAESHTDTDVRLVRRVAGHGRVHLEAFRRVVLSDPALFRGLAAGAPDAFAERCAAAGRERGFDFSAPDVRAALQDARSEWLLRWV